MSMGGLTDLCVGEARRLVGGVGEGEEEGAEERAGLVARLGVGWGLGG